MSGDKTEQPTAQKLKKAKQEGQIGRTQDIGAWFGMLAASIMLPKTLGSAMDHARELMAKVPGVMADPDPAMAMAILKDGMMSASWAVLPSHCSAVSSFWCSTPARMRFSSSDECPFPSSAWPSSCDVTVPK